MKTIKYKYLIALMLIFLGLSCSEDWLDIQQKGAIPQEDFYTTDAECLSALAAVYDMLQVANAQDWVSLHHMKTVLSDECNGGGENAGDQPEYHQMNEYTFTPANTKINDIWQRLYYAVYRANVVIANVEPNNEARTVIVAEAKALRAYIYFELVNLFGEVPLVLTELKPDEYLVEKTSTANIWIQIEKDLSEAIEDLPLKSENGPDNSWRIAKGFAQAMMGKALIFQEKYSEALPYLNEVIASGEYDLVADYDRVLRVENEYGTESLFELGYVTTEGHNWGNYGYWGQGRRQEQNIHLVLWGPRGGFFSGDSLGMFPGWGALPAKELAYEFFNDDDPRRAFNVLSEAEVIANYGSLRDGNNELQYQGEGFLRLKYTTFVDETSGTPGDEPALNLGTNLRIMRYAEVLLLAAEAHLGMGNGNLAAAEINKVRARESVQYTPLATATWDDLKYERATELCFEGHRFYDLVRWGDALTVLGPLGFTAKHAKFPIPQPELDANPALEQNSPW
ncbi:MAG: RagB/SusD family nutrient uptake outer membrane protein [Bacteroidota bacterium]|nr:MAG: RagB/SusD family nutrient uptake outer membrane protein [Bacteroidota bacterium]